MKLRILAAFLTLTALTPFRLLNRPVRSFIYMTSSSIDEINSLVSDRVKCRLNREYTKADQIKEILSNLGVEVIDYPFKDGGSSSWRYKTILEPRCHNIDVMELSKEAIKCAEYNKLDAIDTLVCFAKEHLIELSKLDYSSSGYSRENYQTMNYKDANTPMPLSTLR